MASNGIQLLEAALSGGAMPSLVIMVKTVFDRKYRKKREAVEHHRNSEVHKVLKNVSDARENLQILTEIKGLRKDVAEVAIALADHLRDEHGWPR